MKLGEKAVSEVVGSILTLVITVTLFSAVLAWVLTYPGPTQRAIVDLVPSLDIGAENATISIIHKGGEKLKNEETSINIYINDTLSIHSILDSQPSIGSDWSAGEVWKRVLNITYNDSVTVIVVAKNAIILDVQLQKRGIGLNFPIIHFTWSEPTTVSLGGSFKILVVISDRDNDLSNITVNLTLLGLGIRNLSLSNGVYQTQSLQVPSSASVGVYVFEVNATDYSNNTAKSHVSLRIVTALGVGVDIALSRDDISVSNRNPVKGENLFINVIVRNLGAEAGSCSLVLYDETLEKYRIDNVNVAGGGESSRILWYYNIEPGGMHNLIVVAENVTPPDSDPSNNKVNLQIAVLGKILVVDDDAYPNDGSANDTVGFMETALNSGGFEYTLYQVPSATANGPQYDLGMIKLKDFDIVIWMCGRVTEYTLTGGPYSGDQQNLTKYLRNGGKLWLIGEGIIDGVGTINSFVDKRLHVVAGSGSTDSAPQAKFYGNDSNPLTSGMILENTTLSGGNKGDYFLPDPDALRMFNDTTGICALSFEGDVDNYAVKPTKLVFFTFEFSSIKNADDRAWLAYKILLWFGNVTAKIGRDVAVTDITFQSARVTFRQPVNITAVIRNNGIYEEPRVGVMFYIDDIPIAPPQYVSINASNSTTVSEIWIAQPTGWHVVRVFADPYYEIEETEERNNELRSRVISTQLYVQYSILIVDDDNSTNNGGDGFNTTSYLTSSFCNLSYNYSFWVVPSSATGPNLENLSKYNLVCWCCGNESVTTLTSKDRENILNYLNQSGKLWLIGQGILDELSTADSTFVKNILKIDYTELNTGTPRNIRGLRKDPVTHGIYYATTPVFQDRGDRITPTEEGKPIIFNAFNTSACYGLRLENETYQLIFLPFELGFICGKGVEIGEEYAEATVWEDNFDSAIKWYIQNLGSGYGWEIGEPTPGIGPGTAHSAPNCSATKLAGNYQNYENTWLISPEITLPSDATFIKLSFWHWYEIEKNYDFGRVKIKTAGSTTWDTLATYTGYYRSWHQSTVDLTAYTGKKVNISFHFTSDYSFTYKGWYLDDVKITYGSYQPGAALPPNGERQREEFVVLALTWFGYPEERNELRITDIDLDIPKNPILGRAYEARATIHNVGFKGVSSSVYFYENDIIIDSVSIYVPARNTASTQIIWRPYYAATEAKFRVIVDRDNDVPEIGYPEKLLENNEAIYKTPIYFFYDDFESGSNNWKSSTLTLVINSESYVGCSLPADTDIPTDWAAISSSTYVIKGSTGDSHSKGKSTKILEDADASVGDYAYQHNWAATPFINLTGATAAKLTFWHKFNLVKAANGAYLQIAYENTANGSVETGTPKWKYIGPSRPPYNSNLWLKGDKVYDDYENQVLWCWNGYGTDELCNWEYAELDLAPYIQYGGVKIRFVLTVYGYWEPYNWWYLDDVEIHLYGTPSKLSYYRILAEDFNKAGALPSGWDNTTNWTGRKWEITNDNARYGAIVSGSDYGAVCDSDRAGSGVTVDSWLKSPIINCSGYSTIRLRFTHYYNWYNEPEPQGIYVYVATDGSVDGNDAVVYYSVGADISLREEIIDISSVAGGKSNVQIGWRYYAVNDYWWIIDDVFVETPEVVPYSWQYINTTHRWFSAHSGSYSFWCGNYATGYFEKSTDCSLTSLSIDLTAAKDAKLSFWARWNINGTSGRPPDCVQVLLSEDAGVTWHKINLAIGLARITGDASTNYWEHSDTLPILADLSGWAGEVITLRFRMIVNNDDKLAESTTIGFGGIYIDDVAVIGNSSIGGRSVDGSKGLEIAPAERGGVKIDFKNSRSYFSTRNALTQSNFQLHPKLTIRETEKYFIEWRHIYFVNEEY